MEVFEIINKLLEERGLTKREFARKLIALEPKSNRTGEVISENIIYAYLSGKTSIQSYLIPYISDVLGVPEQFLFEENPKVRKKLLQYLCNTLSKEEYAYINDKLPKEITLTKELSELLAYAPPPLIQKLEISLKKIKEITDEF